MTVSVLTIIKQSRNGVPSRLIYHFSVKLFLTEHIYLRPLIPKYIHHAKGFRIRADSQPDSIEGKQACRHLPASASLECNYESLLSEPCLMPYPFSKGSCGSICIPSKIELKYLFHHNSQADKKQNREDRGLFRIKAK